MSTEETIPQKPNFGRRLWLAFKILFIFVFRILLILLILGAVGVAVYLGAPVLIDQYLLKDVKINSTKIQEISTELENTTEFHTQRLTDLQTRMDSMEIQSDNDKQTIANLQAQLAEAQNALQNQAVSLESLDALQTSLDEFAVELASFEEHISGTEGDLAEIKNEASALSGRIEGNQKELEALYAELETWEMVGDLRQELELLKVMELITRARVSIGDENLGLAKDDLVAAQDLLGRLISQLPSEQALYLSDITQRLNLAVDNLTESPRLANEDLEVAWQLLFEGLPDEAMLTPTPTVSSESEVQTPTPTVTPSP